MRESKGREVVGGEETLLEGGVEFEGNGYAFGEIKDLVSDGEALKGREVAECHLANVLKHRHRHTELL